ncbi:hypothetical protein [Streptomyces tsukubensis]|uniref:Septum formation initiator n=1 Tax=Streptomyces tsukubensis TaxID=83656 RepID=A0A1V4A6Z0_9ACTN|nr:hypothetical protein [Streptomyces tsukubensis]OON77635.1 hypothetical protein B1H18_18025 [Streptomyces tsukubensis]QFR93141.1 cell division protein FtsL [Streptomyces tsukubensis]
MSAGPQLRGRAARLANLLPSGPSTAARTPFVLLVVLLLGGGLITLLLLNSSLNEGSFRLSELKKQTTDLTDEQQELQRDVDAYAAPDALAKRAAELGMVPGGTPAFLDGDGKVRGVPSPAALSSAPPPPRSAAVVAPAPAPSSGPVPSPPSADRSPAVQPSVAAPAGALAPSSPPTSSR